MTKDRLLGAGVFPDSHTVVRGADAYEPKRKMQTERVPTHRKHKAERASKLL